MHDDNPKGTLALLIAVLRRAIMDYLFGKNNFSKKDQESVKLDAAEWIFLETSTEPFSFLWICQELDLDPEGIRGRVGLLKASEIEFNDGGTHSANLVKYFYDDYYLYENDVYIDVPFRDECKKRRIAI